MKSSVHDLNQPSHAGNIPDSSAAFKDQPPLETDADDLRPLPLDSSIWAMPEQPCFPGFKCAQQVESSYCELRIQT